MAGAARDQPWRRRLQGCGARSGRAVCLRRRDARPSSSAMTRPRRRRTIAGADRPGRADRRGGSRPSGRSHPRSHAVLRRVGRSDRRHRLDPHRDRPDQHRRHRQADARCLRAPRQWSPKGSSGSANRRRRRIDAARGGARSGVTTPPPICCTGAADRARRGDAPGRFAGRAGSVAVRLHVP